MKASCRSAAGSRTKVYAPRYPGVVAPNTRTETTLSGIGVKGGGNAALDASYF